MPRRAVLQATALAVLTVLLLWIRRPGEFSAPYLWVEDGQENLPLLAEHGFWYAMVSPLNGYFIAIDKIIILPALKVSILSAPVIALAETVLFTVAVVLSVAFAPTHLRWRPLCAVTCLLIPTAPEVFGTSLYTPWWAGLLVVLVLLWDTNKGLEWLRIGMLTFAGISSPVVLALSALFVMRASIERQKSEWVVAGLAVLLAIVQFSAMAMTPQLRVRGAMAPATSYSVAAIAKLPGYFIAPLAPNDVAAIAIGLAAVIAFGVVVVLLRKRLDFFFWLLLGSLVLITAQILVRVPATAIHPVLAGPRYYFFPFVLGTWLAIWLAAEAGPRLRTVLMACLALSYLQGLRSFVLRSEPMDWEEQIRACANADEIYRLPIHFNGQRERMWIVKIEGSSCRKLVDASLF